MRVQGSGFGLQSSGYRLQGAGVGFGVSKCTSKVQREEGAVKWKKVRVQGSNFRVQGSGFRVQGAGVGVRVYERTSKVHREEGAVKWKRVRVPCAAGERIARGHAAPGDVLHGISAWCCAWGLG